MKTHGRPLRPRAGILFRLTLAALLATRVPTLGAQSAGGEPRPVRRAVLGGKAVAMVADLVYAFPGARSSVLAVAGTDQGLGSFLQVVDPGFASKPVLDRNAGAEVFAGLKPDLVVLKSTMRKSLGAQLESLGLRSLYLDLETPADYERDLAALGAAFGEERRAAELAAWYRAALERVKAPRAGGATAASGRPPRVLVAQASLASGESFEVPPRSWMQSLMVGLAGGEAVWFGANPGEGWGRIGFEQIAAWNPDVLVLVNYREDVDRLASRLRADPRFAALECGKTGRILAFPQDWYSWDQPDTRWGLGLLWLAKSLRPADFADLELLAAARDFYRLFYGLDTAAFDREVLPRLKGDYGRARP